MSWQGSRWFGVLAVLVTGALFALSLDVGPVGPLALVAPLPLLVYALSAPRAWQAGVAAGIARAIGTAGLLVVYGKVIPVPALVVSTLIFAALYAVVVLLTRWIARAAPPALAVFAYPLTLASTEWLFGVAAPHGSFGAMGYALVDILPLLQVASLGGLAALTFVLGIVPITIAVALTRPTGARAAWIAGAVPLVAALAFGGVRLGQDFTSQARVALVGLDAYEARAFRGAADDLETAGAYAAEVRSLAPQAPDYIVLPEKQFGGARDGAGASAVLSDAIAGLPSTTLVAGFDELLADGTRVNSAQLLRAHAPTRRYLKRRMIPGVELGYAAGPGPFVDGARGVAICKDMDFPAMIRGYGERGVELLLVPAWDFGRDGRMHSRMAVVRGVENGFGIARAAAAGRLTVSDRYGRIVAEETTSSDRAVRVVSTVGLRGGGTLYLRAGDLFAWLCIAGTILLVVWRIEARRRT